MKSKSKPNDIIEQEYLSKGLYVAGVDEAGRGCLAGPVVAAAVILEPGILKNPDINDSKKLNKIERESIYLQIINHSICYSVGIIHNDEIDRINILQATFEAMKTAIRGLNIQPAHLLIDGNRYNNNSIPFTTIINGDAKVISIAAASIIAKVTRDRWMVEKAEIQYPEYGFRQHKGYGTKNHYNAIINFGITPLHRKTFLKRIISKQQNLFQ